MSNRFLGGDFYIKKYFQLPYFLFFGFPNMILSDALTLPVSQLQTQQVITSQIRSHIEYLIDLL